MHKEIILGKSIELISKKIVKRSGSTWPGHVALKTNKKFLQKLISKNPNLKLILVAGTNGKTTTTKLLVEILQKNNKSVFSNQEGANLLNGIASTFISHANVKGHIPYDAAILEVDENSLQHVTEAITPDAILVLNLFRDQLDRYGEVNSIAKKWQSALLKIPKKTKLIINGDDPQLRYIGENSELHSFYFGLDEKFMNSKISSHDSDFLYCPHCSAKLEFKKLSYSHMGLFSCPSCKFTHKPTQTFPTLSNPLLGDYNRYNINAAALAAQKVFGIEPKSIETVLQNFKPAFGRQEEIKVRDKNIVILLSKNPTGFNQSIQAVLSKDKNPSIVLVLNDRIPDGRDISWIWDVDFENLKESRTITISGDRALDMTIRIKYTGISESTYTINEKLEDALHESINKTPKEQTLYILATYSGMLETRQILTGKKLL